MRWSEDRAVCEEAVHGVPETRSPEGSAGAQNESVQGESRTRGGGTPGGAGSEGQGQEGQKLLAPRWQRACRGDWARRSRALRGQCHCGGRAGLHHLQTCRESPPRCAQDAPPRCRPLRGNAGARLSSRIPGAHGSLAAWPPASSRAGRNHPALLQKSLPRGNAIRQCSEFSPWEFSGGVSASASWAGTPAASDLRARGADGRARTV